MVISIRETVKIAPRIVIRSRITIEWLNQGAVNLEICIFNHEGVNNKSSRIEELEISVDAIRKDANDGKNLEKGQRSDIILGCGLVGDVDVDLVWTRTNPM